MSKQEDFRRPEKPLEKTPEIDNKSRIKENSVEIRSGQLCETSS